MCIAFFFGSIRDKQCLEITASMDKNWTNSCPQKVLRNIEVGYPLIANFTDSIDAVAKKIFFAGTLLIVYSDVFEMGNCHSLVHLYMWILH